MRCPYRKDTIYIRNIHTKELDETKEFFADCEESECPFFFEEQEVCFRVELDIVKLKGENK